MRMAAALLLGLLWWHGPRVPNDTSLASHATPGVWVMLLQVDCSPDSGVDAEIRDPTGKLLCPLIVGNPRETVVANRCDCSWISEGPGKDAIGLTTVKIGAWQPKGGAYRIR